MTALAPAVLGGLNTRVPSALGIVGVVIRPTLGFCLDDVIENGS